MTWFGEQALDISLQSSLCIYLCMCVWISMRNRENERVCVCIQQRRREEYHCNHAIVCSVMYFAFHATVLSLVFKMQYTQFAQRSN